MEQSSPSDSLTLQLEDAGSFRPLRSPSWRSTSPLQLILIATLLGIPLLVLDGFTNDPYDLPKLALLIIGVGVALGVTCYRYFSGGTFRGPRTLLVPMMSFAIPMTVSWLAAPLRSWSFLGSYFRYTGWLPYILVLILAWMLVEAFWDRPHWLAWTLSIAGGLVGSIAFVQSLGLHLAWSPGSISGSEFPPSTIGHFNFAGGFLAIALPVTVYLWIEAKTRNTRVISIWATISAVLGLLMANSQGGWLAALAGVVVISGSFLSSRWPKAHIGGLVVAALIAIFIVGAVAASFFLRDLDALGETVRTRGLLWSAALEMGTDSPMLGHGPSAYALEGTRYRPLDSVLAYKHAVADEPHSVPLAFWANAGALGALGYVAFIAWLVKLCHRIRRGDHLTMAFFAATAAYLIQSSVSIDLTPLRVALWMALSGLVMSINTHQPSTSDMPSVSRRGGHSVKVIAIALVALLAGASLLYSRTLVLADRNVAIGLAEFDKGDVGAGRAAFDRAIDLRDDPWYRGLYAEQLGGAGLEQKQAGRPLIEEMRDVYSYLDRFPEIRGLLTKARILHYWSRYEPTANEEALAVLVRARVADPENPEVDILAAEVLVDQRRVSLARGLLEEWATVLDGRYGTFWGALSAIRLIDRDFRGAGEALSEAIALDANDCRVQIAQRLMDRHIDPSDQLSRDEELTFRLNCGGGDFYFLQRLISQLRD